MYFLNGFKGGTHLHLGFPPLQKAQMLEIFKALSLVLFSFLYLLPSNLIYRHLWHFSDRVWQTLHLPRFPNRPFSWVPNIYFNNLIDISRNTLNSTCLKLNSVLIPSVIFFQFSFLFKDTHIIAPTRNLRLPLPYHLKQNCHIFISLPLTYFIPFLLSLFQSKTQVTSSQGKKWH